MYTCVYLGKPFYFQHSAQGEWPHFGAHVYGHTIIRYRDQNWHDNPSLHVRENNEGRRLTHRPGITLFRVSLSLSDIIS